MTQRTAGRIQPQKEGDQQAMLFEWAAYSACRYPELTKLFAIPNGGSRHVLEARNLKRQGVRAGVPDICLPISRGGFHGLYIELKRERSSAISDAQLAWISALQDEGYSAEICIGWDEARTTILKYLERDEVAS